MSSPYPSTKKKKITLGRRFLWAAYQYLMPSAFAHKAFQVWWNRFKSDKELPPGLEEMVDYFLTVESSRQASKYWHFLNRRGLLQLNDDGFENFKQSIAKNYFYFGGGIENSNSGYVYKNLRKRAETLDVKVDLKELMKKHQMISLEESLPFNLYTMLLYYYVLETEKGRKTLEKLEEPMEGNPLFITMDGKRITQDLVNSAIEYNSILGGCDITKTRTALELGSGSGRTAYSFLSLNPELRYIVSDIPPALYIAQTYLSNVFSERKVFKFRSFSSFQEIEEEFNRADIVCMTPDQLQMLPDKCIDLFMAIDCLHEMKSETVELYFSLADRLASNFYFKCWERTSVRFDNDEHTRDSYPARESWTRIFDKTCEVPNGYFEAMYTID